MNMFAAYEQKLNRRGLIPAGEAILGFLDAELGWNRPAGETRRLARVFERLNINSLILARPAEPYFTAVEYLARNAGGVILPEDCETRTFFHDLPVAKAFTAEEIVKGLSRRKSLIIPGRGIVTSGTVSLEQAYVSFSSACFACLVKFFVDLLRQSRQGGLTGKAHRALERAASFLDPPAAWQGRLAPGPFTEPSAALAAMAEAGGLTVDFRLVDSFFGNISYLVGETLYISQTGSSLDELEGAVDPCPLDGSSCAPITASSELPAHLALVEQTGCRAILHGHPRFAVILSLDCTEKGCRHKGHCHTACPRLRFAGDTPIVPGEVGSGPHGLCRTVPEAIQGRTGVIVYGHGLFTTGQTDFNAPFNHLLEIENTCREIYFRRLGG